MTIDRPTFWTLLGLITFSYMAGKTGDAFYAIPVAWFCLPFIWDGIYGRGR